MKSRTILPALFALVIIFAAATTLDATPVRERGRWVFENDAVRVNVHETSAVWDVLDNRCHRLWRQAEGSAKDSLAVRKIAPMPTPAEGVRIDLEYSQIGGGFIQLTIRLWLGDGEGDVHFEKLWAQKDLLHMIHASMPTWVLWDPQQSLFWGNRERFKECYDNVCRWRRAVGYSEMTNHERLSEDGLVQRSRFANGAAVTVNFATEKRAVDGIVLPPLSFLITGDAPELKGLPVNKPVSVDDRWEPKEFVSTASTGFEDRPCPWKGLGVSLELQEEIVHGGRTAAKLSGTQSEGYSYAASIEVPIEAGGHYTLRGWLRVDAMEPAGFAPSFKCGIYQDKKWVTNFFTPQYDLSRPGTWQKLECAFTAPENATGGRLALEKRTTGSVTATLYIDDIELVPAETEPANVRDGK